MIGDRRDHRSVKTCISNIVILLDARRRGKRKEGREKRKEGKGSIARARKNGRFDLFFVGNVRPIARSREQRQPSWRRARRDWTKISQRIFVFRRWKVSCKVARVRRYSD